MHIKPNLITDKQMTSNQTHLNEHFRKSPDRTNAVIIRMA